MNAALRALTENFQVLAVFRGDDHRLGFRFVEHPDVIAEEPDACGHALPRALHQFRMRVCDGDQLHLRFFGDIFEQAPDVVMVEANHGKSSACSLALSRQHEKRQCGYPEQAFRHQSLLIDTLLGQPGLYCVSERLTTCRHMH